MSKEGNPGLKIFLQFSLFIALLAGFNLYSYFRQGSRLFLVVGLVCVAVLIGWALFYVMYVRKNEQ